MPGDRHCPGCGGYDFAGNDPDYAPCPGLAPEGLGLLRQYRDDHETSESCYLDEYEDSRCEKCKRADALLAAAHATRGAKDGAAPEDRKPSGHRSDEDPTLSGCHGDPRPRAATLTNGRLSGNDESSTPAPPDDAMRRVVEAARHLFANFEPRKKHDTWTFEMVRADDLNALREAVGGL